MEDNVSEKPLYGIDWSLTFDHEYYPDKPVIQVLSGDYAGSKFLMRGCSMVEHDGYAEMKLDCKTVEVPEWCDGEENILDHDEVKKFIGDIVVECLERYCEQ